MRRQEGSDKEAGVLRRATATVEGRGRLRELAPKIALVLGSGLGALTDALTSSIRIPYAEIPGFPIPKVAGHGGELVAGRLEGVPVLAQSGRFHLYEGHSPDTVARPVRVFAELGIRTLIVTNSAGGLRLSLHVPQLMLIVDHINLVWRNPLIGPVVEGEERFPDMSCPYDDGLRRIAKDVARERAIALDEGAYAGVLGPSYETPAEIRMLQRLGADAVGMSTVPEVVVARARGMQVLGISTISNYGSGMTPQPLAHEGVLEAGRVVARDLRELVIGVVARLAHERSA